MNRKAILSGAMLLPTELINLQQLKRRLTITHTPLGEDESIQVKAYYEKRGYLAVPRQYGLALVDRLGLEVEDKTSPGTAALWPRRPVPREYQEEFINDLGTCTDEYYDFLARAHTGFGKTVSSLVAAARIGRTTLIIVDQENLRDQWLTELATHFGMTRENGLVGIVQGKHCEYEGRSVVIAMVQTLASRRFSQEFYNWAGVLIVDEVHTIGAPVYSQPLMKITATIRWGVSATTKRGDAFQKFLDYHLGAVRVAADKEHDTSVVYFVQHKTVYTWYANVSKKIGRIITEVAEDGSRNLLLAQAAQWLYETGRDILLLSDRIDQLKHVMSLMTYLGVAPEVMGLYTGNHPQYRYAKDTSPKHLPVGLVLDAPYTPVSLQLIAKTIPKKILDEVKDKAEIQLATFQKAGKGYDVPRLSGGVDLTPRSKAEQAHGRILRVKEGKKKPIWVTVEDTRSYRLVRSFALRLQEYCKSNARVYQWHENGELEECLIEEVMPDRMARVARLQLARIETSKDGRNMLKTQESVRRQNAQAVLATVKQIRSRNRS